MSNNRAATQTSRQPVPRVTTFNSFVTAMYHKLKVRPGPPVWYFVWGPLANADVIQELFNLPDPPVLKRASVLGHEWVKLHGREVLTRVQRVVEAERIEGWAFEAFENQYHFLCNYMDDIYHPVPPAIFDCSSSLEVYIEGVPRSAETFSVVYAPEGMRPW